MISSHLIGCDPRIKVVLGYEPMRVPVLLHYHKQPFYTELHKLVAATALVSNVSPLLSPTADPGLPAT